MADRILFGRCHGHNHALSGRATPPFVPGGPWYSRMTIVVNQKERGEYWFRNDNQQVQEWFAFLRRSFVKNELRVDRVPDWILENDQVKPYFGIADQMSPAK
jgi:hypothetical protein